MTETGCKTHSKLLEVSTLKIYSVVRDNKLTQDHELVLSTTPQKLGLHSHSKVIRRK